MSESAGRVLMIPKGTYSPTTTYDPLDAVKYEHNSYVCKQTSRGNLPTNTTYWQPLTDVTADEIPTEGSTNLVQSGGVYSANQTLTSAFTNNVNVNGCKNLFLVDLEKIISTNKGGTWNGNKFTQKGATYTINDNDSVTFGGTPTEYTQIVFPQNISKADKYMLSGLSGCTNVVFGGCSMYLNDTLVSSIVINSKQNTELDLSSYTFDRITIDVKRTANNIAMSGTAFIMLCLKSDWDLDNTWVAPSKTNRQLTKDSVTWTDYAKSGAVNVIPFDLAKAKAANTLGTWSGNTYTENNVTFAFNDDGTLVVNTSGATARTTFQYYEAVADVWLEKNRVYKASAFNEIVKDGTTGFFIQLFRGGRPYPRIALFNEQPFVVDNQYFGISTTLSVQIVVENGTVVTNQTIKPIISDAAYNGGHVPYAKTNKELTDESKLITLPATKNDSIVDSFVIRVRKQHNAVYVTGYFSIEVAANKDDLLFTISDLNFFDANDHFYVLMMSSGGNMAFAEVNSNGAVKVESNAGMPTGYYIAYGVLLMK